MQKVSHNLTDPEIAGKAGIVTAKEQQRICEDCSNLVQEFLLRMMDHYLWLCKEYAKAHLRE